MTSSITTQHTNGRVGIHIQAVSVLRHCQVHHSQHVHSASILYAPPPHVSIMINLGETTTLCNNCAPKTMAGTTRLKKHLLFPHCSPSLLRNALLSFLMNLSQRGGVLLGPSLEASLPFLPQPVFQREWITFKCLNTPVSEGPSHILLPYTIFS